MDRACLLRVKSLRRRIAQHSIGPSHCIFAGVFLLRLLVLVRLTNSPFLLPNQGDMHFYNDWALRILHGQWTDHQAFYGLPLYPFLLAGIYKIFGFSPFLPALLQALLEGGTAVLLYKLAVKIFATTGNGEPTGNQLIHADFGGTPAVASPFSTVTRTGQCPSLQGEIIYGIASNKSATAPRILQYRGQVIGILAAAGWAFFQPAEAYSVIIMPTVWLVFIFWFVVWQIVNRRHAPTFLSLFLLGGLIGFSAMGIATILFLIPLVLAAIFFKWQFHAEDERFESRQAMRPPYTPWRRRWVVRGHAWSARLITIGFLFLGIGMGASPAWIHNYFVARDPVLLSAHGGVNFWIGNNPSANGYPKFPSGLHAGQEGMLKESITQAETAAGHPLKRSAVSAYWSAKAKHYIEQHPGDWLKLLGRKVRNFWNAFQYDDLSIVTTLREEGVIFPGLSFGIIAALAIPGLLLASVTFPLSRWIAAAILLHMLSLLSVFVTERYRLAAVPGLLLFAAFALWELWQTLLRVRYRRALAYSASLLVSAWFVSVPERDPSLWALDSYNTGLHALDSNHLEQAEQKLVRAYAYVPENTETNFALGNLKLAQGDKTAAKSYYLSTLRLDPKHEGAYNNLGVIALQEGQWKLAATLFRKALEQDPYDAKAYYLLAQAYFNDGDLAHASAEISQALKLNPGQAEFRDLHEQIQRSQIKPLSGRPIHKD